MRTLQRLYRIPNHFSRLSHHRPRWTSQAFRATHTAPLHNAHVHHA
jgi:hypothetical protein